MTSTMIDLPDLDSLKQVAKQLASKIPRGSWVYLVGDLGVGKTTFSQFFIAQKGCCERVTSPTYALMQDYRVGTNTIIHCDLYRLADPEELYEIGLLDLAQSHKAIVLVEWPEKGKGILPMPNFTLSLTMTNHQTQHRTLTLTEHKP